MGVRHGEKGLLPPLTNSHYHHMSGLRTVLSHDPLRNPTELCPLHRQVLNSDKDHNSTQCLRLLCARHCWELWFVLIQRFPRFRSKPLYGILLHNNRCMYAYHVCNKQRLGKTVLILYYMQCMRVIKNNKALFSDTVSICVIWFHRFP